MGMNPKKDLKVVQYQINIRMFNTQCCLSSLSALHCKVRRENIHKWIELEKEREKNLNEKEEKVRSMSEYEVEMLFYVASKVKV